MTDQQKIILVGPAYPYRGGQALVEAYMHHLLTTIGYDASTVSYTLLYPSVFFPGTTQFDSSSFVPFPHPGKIKRLLSSVNPLTWLRTARYIRQQQPAAVIFVWWMPFFGPALATIARLIRKRTKIFFLVENFVSHEKRKFDFIATMQTLRYADAFISESNYITKQLQQHFPKTPLHEATLSVYDCYDLKQYDQQSAREKLGIKTKEVVLFFGLIRPYKGLQQLLRTVPELLQAGRDLTLLIVGECYEDVQGYEQLIDALGIRDRVLFVNRFMPNEEVEPYFKASDLVCLPYHSGTQSGILMMAYGFKKPVVVTDVGGIAELVQHRRTGYVVPDNSTAHLKEGIDFVLDHRQEISYADNIGALIHDAGYQGLAQFIDQTIRN